MTTPRRPTFSAALCYRDPKAALAWLERAFGFQRSIVVTTPEGDIAYAEMKFGDSVVMVGGSWADFIASPEDTAGRNTQTVRVHLPDDADIDAHCERARAAGAEILQAPADQFYGERVYRARDPGRHVWTVGKHVREVSNDEMSAATGLTIEVFR
ncbi:VOC family protein [Burkholderia anthina]|uniref:VOC family protein n=1 Tax=Burkholderia anthina TaxID=179879 RepID=UPI00158D78FC|nr:VOC family protein [Burkholderia anthina]